MKKLFVLFCVVLLTACTEYRFIDPQVINEFSKVCDNNGGVEQIRIEVVGHDNQEPKYYAMYCNNGARFFKKLEEIKKDMENKNNE